MYWIFYGDVTECGGAVMISDKMKVTVIHTGKHEGLSWVAGGTVMMGSIICKEHMSHLKWGMFWCCY